MGDSTKQIYDTTINNYIAEIVKSIPDHLKKSLNDYLRDGDRVNDLLKRLELNAIILESQGFRINLFHPNSLLCLIDLLEIEFQEKKT